ncbi:glycosyltransferase family 2 protein [Methylocystis sp. WRRC1]|uniref:glycosyltransferase family 2 protein n=1 Tax=Methylocystis sp. WRRC1 TaxID=1732014 RepID=UPI001D14CEC8|nr:glycosyltransferase family 2 protein [Methylocystis sp. WRRC1]MCC3244456.1 glycosyltransferase family 2 protein [Methylocystis sp. WRRC1]
MLKAITPVILTYNEEANIGRTLSALNWADDIVVVDSYSTDATIPIVSGFLNVRIVQRRFDKHANQWNFAIAETDIATDWILALDADYLLTAEFVTELAGLAPGDCDAYSADFIYCIKGHRLRGGLYPRATLLFRRQGARYVQSGHTQRLEVAGPVQRLSAKVLHDDRKSLARWLRSQQNYARLEAEHLLADPPAGLRAIDRLRRMAWPAPILMFFYALLIKGCILDGWPGWLYVLQRTLAEIIIAMEIVDRSLREDKPTP